MTAYTELQAIIGLLPSHIQEDINKRVSDWFRSGGKVDDDYIKQQLRYAKVYVEKMKESNN